MLYNVDVYIYYVSAPVCTSMQPADRTRVIMQLSMYLFVYTCLCVYTPVHTVYLPVCVPLYLAGTACVYAAVCVVYLHVCLTCAFVRVPLLSMTERQQVHTHMMSCWLYTCVSTSCVCRIRMYFIRVCVCTYLCVYGMSREKSRKLAAPWSSLVWKNSSSTEGSFTRATQSWFNRRTSSASTTPPLSVGSQGNHYQLHLQHVTPLSN